MSLSQNRESAKIIQFPVGGRKGFAGATKAVATPNVPTVSYDSWYHDAAIADAAKDSRH